MPYNCEKGAYYGSRDLRLKCLENIEYHDQNNGLQQNHSFVEGVIGCGIVAAFVNSDDYEVLEREFNIPQIVGFLMEEIFDFLPEDQCRPFVWDCYQRMREGKDFSDIGNAFAVWFLKDPVYGVNKGKSVYSSYEDEMLALQSFGVTEAQDLFDYAIQFYGCKNVQRVQFAEALKIKFLQLLEDAPMVDSE